MMNLTMETQKMNNVNFENKLENLLKNLDLDFVGANGEEYLWSKAKLKGFKSNFDYSLAKAKEKYDSPRNIIGCVISSAIEGWSGYYEATEYSIEEVNNEYIVTIAVANKN